MVQKPTPRLPDRTGILILPAGVFAAAAWFAIALAYDAYAMANETYRHAQLRYVREQLLSDMIAALARMLGLWGSFAVAAVLIGASGAWFGRAILHYRARVAADRKAVGLPG
ncbi:MAG: hypothetical protein ACXWP4_28050 [Polyangiales bacterium]